MFSFGILITLFKVAHHDIANTQTATRCLVGVGWSDAFQSRANLHLSKSFLVGSIQNSMCRQNEMRLVRDHETLREVDASSRQSIDFVFQDLRIDDDAIAYHVDALIVKRS